jgi:hypothetical protein
MPLPIADPNPVGGALELSPVLGREFMAAVMMH